MYTGYRCILVSSRTSKTHTSMLSNWRNSLPENPTTHFIQKGVISSRPHLIFLKRKTFFLLSKMFSRFSLKWKVRAAQTVSMRKYQLWGRHSCLGRRREGLERGDHRAQGNSPSLTVRPWAVAGLCTKQMVHNSQSVTARNSGSPGPLPPRPFQTVYPQESLQNFLHFNSPLFDMVAVQLGTGSLYIWISTVFLKTQHS